MTGLNFDRKHLFSFSLVGASAVSAVAGLYDWSGIQPTNDSTSKAVVEQERRELFGNGYLIGLSTGLLLGSAAAGYLENELARKK